MFEQRRQGAVDVVSGDVCLTLEMVKELEDTLAGCIEHRQPKIVLDLEQVPLISSDGLTSLLDMQDQCIRRGGRLRLAAPNDLLREIFFVTGVEDHFEIYDDVVDAVGSFAV